MSFVNLRTKAYFIFFYEKKILHSFEVTEKAYLWILTQRVALSKIFAWKIITNHQNLKFMAIIWKILYFIGFTFNAIVASRSGMYTCTL